ncbi:MAG: 4Fe-4S binding protein [candidate division WOR-3 bacterium]|nr:MAG: 4Fe-4S binding protein [candidate division WOR-3 bacterium]
MNDRTTPADTRRFKLSKLVIPAVMTAAFWAIAVLFWRLSGHWFFLVNFGYIGLSVGFGMALYTPLPRRRKPWGRRITQFLVGAYMLGLLGLVARENMQLEGFFHFLLAGFFAGAVIHYTVAKLLGPLLFGRAWCGWACWTAMVLDLLPFKRNQAGRLPGPWGLLRYLHFSLSLVVVLVLWFVFRYQVRTNDIHSLYWLAVGNVIYHGVGILLAVALRDNRAFCKYVCPIPTLQKVLSRFALLKISGNRDKCTECGACARACPMDIRVHEYAARARRVLSTECIQCFECENVCPRGALRTTFRFDGGNSELIRTRRTAEPEP